MKWDASEGSVRRYRIYRNGVRVGRSYDLRFTEWVPRGTRKVTYVVRAVDRWGHVSPKSKSYTIYMWR